MFPMSKRSYSPEPGEMGYSNPKFISEIGYRSMVSPEAIINQACDRPAMNVAVSISSLVFNIFVWETKLHRFSVFEGT